jgi:hypothetical protein
MTWNAIPDEERLRLWKKLRNELTGLPIEQQLSAIAKFCSAIPCGARTLDYYSAENWPTPWEILYHGSFCISSISLLMYYTITVTNSNLANNVELWLVKDNDGDYLLPVINDQFILNYESGTVSNHSEICDYFIVMQKFSRLQIKTIA